jgi:hypothetical protein
MKMNKVGHLETTLGSCKSNYAANRGKNKSARLVTARLVAPPMMCYNQAGTPARAVGIGVALGVSPAKSAARFVGFMCQLCNVCADVQVGMT